mmetsp:Transcript_20708/g.58077  ORF Transcript_20708/g.58077 Transcript_20708/m.58077 type:complete len:798 (+) Transcript_20708:84-2477(+)
MEDLRAKVEDPVKTESPEQPFTAAALGNSTLRNVFQDDADGVLAPAHRAAFFLGLSALIAAVFIGFSGVTDVSYEVHAGLMRMEPIWWIFVCFGLGGAFVLHTANWYRWPLRGKMLPAVVVMYVFFAGIVCHAKEYPGAPMIIAILHFPILTALARYYTRKTTSQSHFYKDAGMCYASLTALSLVVWTLWIVLAEMPWGRSTKQKVQRKLGGVHDVFEVSSWSACELERQHRDSANAKMLDDCSKIEMTGWLVWASPLVLSVVLAVLAIFCFIRRYVVAPGSRGIVKVLLFLACAFAAAFWAAAATAGASMGLSELYLISLGAAMLVCIAWLLFVIDLEDLQQQVQKSTIFTNTVLPALQSDYAYGLIFAISSLAVLLFLALEVVVRQFQRLLRIPARSQYITNRGGTLIKLIQDVHWTCTLEKAFFWCMFFLTFFLFTKFTPVFLSWLGTELKRRPFGPCVLAFYVAGIIMFLLPPVPGVPVYMAAGTIIVARGKEEPWLSFWTGICFASVLGLILKLNAVAIQQKVIGEGFGKYQYVQRLVGIHTVQIRAIQKILERDGLSMEKVAILVGGPDWPTSVLTGILHLRLPQMLLGTLPCFFLIVPCVIGGASLSEDSLKSFSPMIILGVGVSQGAVMLMALLFIAKETQDNLTELSKPLPEHESLWQKTKEAESKKQQYKENTRWSRMTIPQKVFLLFALAAEITTCWLFQFFGSTLFRRFDISGNISYSYENGGLNKNPFNLIKPPGQAVCVAMLLGIASYIVYTVLTRHRRAKQTTPGAATVMGGIEDAGGGEGK